MPSTECLYELNSAGGFISSHKLFCGYQRECCEEATVHVRVIDRGWCGNVCKKCKERIARDHRIAVDEKLRGLSSEENYDSDKSSSN